MIRRVPSNWYITYHVLYMEKSFCGNFAFRLAYSSGYNIEKQKNIQIYCSAILNMMSLVLFCAKSVRLLRSYVVNDRGRCRRNQALPAFSFSFPFSFILKIWPHPYAQIAI